MGLGFDLDFRRRLLALALLLVVASLVLLLGLFKLQVLESDEFSRLALGNRLRFIREVGPRGNIYDRRGMVLAANSMAFSLSGYPLELRRPEVRSRVLRFLSSNGFGMDEADYERLISSQFVSPYVDVSLVRDLTLHQLAELVSMPDFPPELFPKLRFRRVYPLGSLTAHAVGYVGEISLEELKEWGGDYRGGDVVGKMGVERFYEEMLRGGLGGEYIEVDALGRKLRSLSYAAGSPGNDLQLTLDADLQRALEGILGEERGSIVVMDVRTGDLLGLLCKPSYDPNVISFGVSAEEWRSLLSDPSRPMMNRAISGTYAPGSTFKPFVGLAALETKAVSPSQRFSCPGYFELGNRVFRCWQEGGHGQENLVDAIKDSCNVYFFNVGLIVGPEDIVKYARLFGLGRPTGVDLPGEAEGLIPDPAWKERRLSERWYRGDTVNLSIGQGYVLATPIQVAVAYAALANGGFLVRPRVWSGRGVERVSLGLSSRSVLEVRKGLLEAVRSGTARRAASSYVSVAGKTGTAQNPHGKEHTWFVGFAPADDPKVVVVVMVEHGESAAMAAAPRAKQVFDYLFSRGEIR